MQTIFVSLKWTKLKLKYSARTLTINECVRPTNENLQVHPPETQQGQWFSLHWSHTGVILLKIDFSIRLMQIDFSFNSQFWSFPDNHLLISLRYRVMQFFVKWMPLYHKTIILTIMKDWWLAASTDFLYQTFIVHGLVMEILINWFMVLQDVPELKPFQGLMTGKWNLMTQVHADF